MTLIILALIGLLVYLLIDPPLTRAKVAEAGRIVFAFAFLAWLLQGMPTRF